MTSWIEKKTKIAVAAAASMLVTILMKMRPDTMTFRFPAQDRSEAIWQMRKPHVKKVSALTSNVVAKRMMRGCEAALHLAACNATGDGVVAGCGGIAHPVGAVDAERNLEVVRCLGLDLNDRLGAIATLPAVFDDLVGDLRRCQRPGIASKTCRQRAGHTKHAMTCPSDVWGRGARRRQRRVACSATTLIPEVTAFAIVLPNKLFCLAASFTLLATMVLKLSATMRLTRTPMPALKAAPPMTSAMLDGVSAVNLTYS